MVRASDSGPRDREFDSRASRSVDCQVITLGKLFTPMYLCHQAV